MFADFNKCNVRQSVPISEEKRTVEGAVAESFGRAAENGESSSSEESFCTLSEEKIAKLLKNKQRE